MQIDADKLQVVADRLAAKCAGQYVEAAVTIGEIDGRVFRLVVMNDMLAEDEDCADGPDWANCITSNDCSNVPTDAEMQRATLADLNKREPKPAMILRLLTEAQMGKTVNVSVAEALEFRRDQYGLTQGEFAAILGLHSGRYSEIINGKRRLPIEATKRAFAIGVPAEVLLQPDA